MVVKPSKMWRKNGKSTFMQFATVAWLGMKNDRLKKLTQKPDKLLICDILVFCGFNILIEYTYIRA